MRSATENIRPYIYTLTDMSDGMFYSPGKLYNKMINLRTSCLSMSGSL